MADEASECRAVVFINEMSRTTIMCGRCERAVVISLLSALSAPLATTPAVAELVDDPYVLNWADGAGAVAHELAANTGTPVVFDLSYGSWSISFVGDDLYVALTVNPMTGTPQLQPSFGAGDLDWSPLPGTITGLVRDSASPGYFFDLTVISLDGGVSGSSTLGLSLVNASNEPSVAEWIFTIEVEHAAPGDANGDGKVDGIDYLIWADNFGDNPADDPPGAPENGDFNGDGVVNGIDYLTWAGNFGQGPNEGVAVPEPASWMLLAIGGGVALARPRRPRSSRELVVCMTAAGTV